MNSGLIVGTCTEMCPRDEERLRRKHELIDPLEKSLGICIKAYSRSAAGAKEAKPSSLRTPSTCLKTANFLLDKIALHRDLDLNAYAFILDRLRSIRQDLIIQNVNNDITIRIYEICVKFLLFSGYEFCETSSKNMYKYDSHQNYEQLRACLKTLLGLYTELNHFTPESMGMISAYLLLDIDSSQPLLWLLGMSSSLGWNKDVNVTGALKVLKAFRENNFVALFRSIPELGYLAALAFHNNLRRIYRTLLEVMVSAYGVSSCQYPIHDFCRLFKLRPSECLHLLRSHLSISLEETSQFIPFRKNALIPNVKVANWKTHVIEDHLKEFKKEAFFTLCY